MNRTAIISLCLLVIAVSTQVESRKRKPQVHPTRPLRLGWRLGKGPCVCNGTRPSNTPGRPTRHRSTARHHPFGPHSLPDGPHSPRPRHHSTGSPPTGSIEHRRNGPRRPPRRRGPNRRPVNNDGPRKRGAHGRRPKRKHVVQGQYQHCVCRRRAAKNFKIKFRMMKTWRPEMADRKSSDYKRLIRIIAPKLAKVLKADLKSIHNMRFTKGSIVVEFEVNKSEVTEDPEKALKHAIRKGHLSDLEIDTESLAISQSYSGVKLTEWQTNEADCSKCGLVRQTRNCIEVTASCDGIPLSRNASCYDVCPRPYSTHCRGRPGFKMTKVMIIACITIVGVMVVAAVLIITKIKRARHVYLSTSPSTSSLKQLTEEKSQSKC